MWLTGLLAALAAGLFALSLVLKLRERGIDPLHMWRCLFRRPWFERLLLLFLVCGLVQYAATKNTGRARFVPELETRFLSPTAEDGDSILGGTVTNLCFTGISVQTNGVELDVAWPTNLFLPGTTLDFFARSSLLTNAWRWFASYPTSPGMTNVSVLADWQDGLLCASNPPAMFFKVQDRQTCASTMADADGDGAPDVYELHNGTNPYVDDYALAPRLTVGTNGAYRTLAAALAASTDYSIVELPSEAMTLDETVSLPAHPVLITGPSGGYARLYSSADIAMFLLDEGQGRETVFRNLYVALTARQGFQAAFWIGGNLPWSGVGASPAFENVRVRALYPDVLHYGWHYYRDDGGRSQISNCAVNAAGSTSAIGVYAYDGPDVGIADCVFVNFPTNAGSFASWIREGTNVVAALPQADTNLSWAGYALDGGYSPTLDSDGDGLSDEAEVRVHDTDPWLPDSDGDGLTDAEEIGAGTDPRDLYSFYRRVTVMTDATDGLAAVTNYVAWGTSSAGWETNGLSPCWTLPSTNVYDAMSSSGPMYVKAYRDLNRNGRYDADADVILIEQVPPLDAVSTFTLRFGDVDGDGVSDADERQDGTDPYDRNSFRFRATVTCTNSDTAGGVTNHLGLSGQAGTDDVAFVASGTLSIDLLLTNGLCSAFCWRDFDGDGLYDADRDVLYARTLTKADNGKTIFLSIGDADSDGQPDSSELSRGTDPANAKNYCFNLAFVEKGIFGTTNALTAEVLFGTNVLVGPVALTNRTWAVDLGHLVASNGETAAAWFWDDANSNGVREAGECATRQTFAVKGHENVLTNTLAMGAFDRDNDEMPDYWERLHADAGLSPTNAADAYADGDGDGLINLHEYWAGCDPNVPDGSNTLLAAMAISIDGRLKTNDIDNTKYKFNNYRSYGYSHIFITNSNFWAQDVDTTCASMWNDFAWPGEFRKAGTLISRRHMLFANHFPAETNKFVWFVGSDGNVYSNTIINTASISNTDIQIALLATDMDEHVHATKILPKCFPKYINTGRGLPILAFDYDEHGIVYEIERNLPISDSLMGERTISTGIPHSSRRSSYYENIIVGDSGNPCFLLIGTNTVFLGAAHTGNHPTGPDTYEGSCSPFVTYYAEVIQETMDILCPGYSLSYIDLTRFETLKNE